MAEPLVDDRLWPIIEPLIPVGPHRFRHPRRGRVPDRACLTGILFVRLAGIPLEYLPGEMSCGSGMTCWRRLGRAAGQPGLAEGPRGPAGPPACRGPDRLVPRAGRVWHGPHGREGELTGPNPTDRHKPGSKHHVISNGLGTALVAKVTAASVPDGMPLLDLIDAIPSVRGRVGVRCDAETAAEPAISPAWPVHGLGCDWWRAARRRRRV